MIKQEFMSTVYVVKDGKVLLVYNEIMNNWIALGGHVDPDELPCHPAIREAKEESGLDIELIQDPKTTSSANIIQPHHIHLDHVRADHKHINLMYFGRVVGGKQLAMSDENTELKWFSKDDLAKMKDMIPNVKEWALKSIEELG